ncbi:hypothetical protein DFH07DRAFT_788700 [Mycena maculata]|uniref:Pentatricopeptide repeat-containing protein n=1 Tax=Mycena maculata TaxID=230809 RepID=A0AAD7P1B8_9AGAR|nr:hypothetical protein DFH07DRAFT_788700 [Mycena maculata]
MLSSRLTIRVPQFPARIVRAASFPPKHAPKVAPFAAPETSVDPVLLLQLRERIIERHNPSSIDLDEPRRQRVNKSIFNIRTGLERRDINLIQKSWEELCQANDLHILTGEVFEEIGRLVAESLLSTVHPPEEMADSARRLFVEQVALAAAGRPTHSTDALNACFIVYLRRGEPRAVLELYKKFKQFPRTQDPTINDTDLDLVHIEDEFDTPTSDTLPGRVTAFLAVVTAFAVEDSFSAALKEYIRSGLRLPTAVTEEFLRTMSHDSALQNKVDIFIRRLPIGKSVARPHTLSKHLDRISKQREPASPSVENLYSWILDAMTEPDAYIAPDLNAISDTKPVAMCELIWASFLAAFLRQERNDLAAKLWKDMAQFGIKPGIMTWNMVLTVYLDRRATKEVLGAWGTMTSHGVKPDSFTYRIVISALFQQKRIAEALRWLGKFEADVKPSSTAEQTLPVYNAVLHHLLRLGRENAKTAFSLLEKMEKEGPKPDLVSYNTLMGYHSRQSDLKGMASTISQMAVVGVKGDVFTFSTILSALLKVGRADAPAIVLGIMRKQGVLATVAIYSAIINSQVQQQSTEHLQAAFRLLDEMENDSGVVPNEITYTSLLSGLYRGNWLSQDQLELHRKDIVARMKRKKLKFHSQGYNYLIKACLDSEGSAAVENALGFYREMVRNNVPRVGDTWYVLLAGLAGHKEWQIAQEIADEMFSSGAYPRKSVYRLVEKIRQEVRQ